MGRPVATSKLMREVAPRSTGEELKHVKETTADSGNEQVTAMGNWGSIPLQNSGSRGVG